MLSDKKKLGKKTYGVIPPIISSRKYAQMCSNMKGPSGCVQWEGGAQRAGGDELTEVFIFLITAMV